MMLKFVSYVLDKSLVIFHRFISFLKEVGKNVSIISEQPPSETYMSLPPYNVKKKLNEFSFVLTFCLFV
jgi:hypothetical protein